MTSMRPPFNAFVQLEPCSARHQLARLRFFPLRSPITDILHVRRLRSGALELLVRWAGEHPDEWVRQSALEPSMQKQAVRWARHVLGYVRRGPITVVRQKGVRFRRLLRGGDVGSASRRARLW